MRTILCFGDSHTWGCIPLTGPHPPRRYEPARRWPGVLRRELGDGFWIVEEGLNGRTTVWDDPLEPFRSGKELLAPCLLTHQPVDLVPEGSPPQALLLCPPTVGRLGLFAEEFAGAHVRSSDTDGIHLDALNHERLGVTVAQQVRLLFA